MKKLFTFILFTFLVSALNAQVSKTVDVTTPGTLTTLLTASEKKTITNLTVTGNIDTRDIKCMRNEMTVLSNIDISSVNIISFSGTGGTNFFNYNVIYPANEMPESSFHVGPSEGKTTIESVILPKNLTSIGKNALIGCHAMKSITIPESVTNIGDWAFCNCTGLKTVRCLANTPPNIGAHSFSISYDSETYLSITNVFIPKGTLSLYKANAAWAKFSKVMEYALTVSTKSITSITLNSATFNGSMDLILDSPVSSYGFCWNTTGSPTISDNKIDKGTTVVLGSFNHTITDLLPSTKYYVRTYATDATGTAYGNEISFTTASLPSAAGSISGLQTVCQGQNSVIYSVPVIDNATSYIWTLPTGVTGSGSTNTITVNYSRTFTSGSITVKGHNQWGDGTSSALAVTANLLPADAGTITGSTIICQGESNITYSVPEIANATSYIWNLPTGATGSSSTNSITVNYSKTAISGNITVKGRNECGDGIASVLAITINKLPVITNTQRSLICGSSIALNPTISYSGTGTLKYKWTPATGLNNDSIANPTATVINDITYTVTVTTPNGCTASDELKFKIIPMDKPQIGIVGVNGNNKNVVVWNKPVSSGIDSYSVYKETNVSNVYEKIGSVPYSELSVYVDDASNPTVKSSKYKLSIVDKSGLETLLSEPHKTMHLSINKGQNNTWNLIWEPYTGFTPATYNIYRGSNANSLGFLDATSGSSTQFSDISAPSGDVFYQVEVISPVFINPSRINSNQQKISDSGNVTTVSYNSSRSNIATNFSSGINDLKSESNNIHVYPNPAKGQFKIEFAGGSVFEIQNLTGQLIYSGNLNNSNIVRTDSFKSGVYLIRFNTGKSVEFKKIIIE